MYTFSYFKETDKQVLLEFMADHPFIFLTGSFNNGEQVATQIPVLTEVRGEELILQGHLMRKTDHHRAFMENPQALAVFTGPQAYVSASWYTNPRIGSTWNYMSIHVAGEMEFMTDDALEQFMRKFTLHFESGNRESPTFFDNLPGGFLSKMMPGIVGFEIRASSINNVFKLSQNRDEASYLNIISHLEGRGGDAAKIAGEMRKRQAALFPQGVEWDPSRFDS
ncbi:MAG: FMN-binding negative transcriptional regulator [Chitinophagaceae bacterium]